MEEGGVVPAVSKSEGQGIMLGVYLSEVEGGVMSFETEIAAVFLEYGKGNYWTSDRMIADLRKVIAIRKKKYPWAHVIWRFDHSSNHTKKALDALNAFIMNINDGGRANHAFMRPAIIQQDGLLIKRGAYQLMTTFDKKTGKMIHRGLETVLIERLGKDKVKAFVKSDLHNRAWHLRQELNSHVDFRDANTCIHDLLEELCPGDICRFYPKFHCEFPPV